MNMKTVIPVLALAMMLMAGAAPASGNRVALVIGNQNYSSSPLNNTLKDADGMTRALREGGGFEVHTVKDASKEVMLRAINTFGEKLRSADVGLFYFSGHGLQSGGRNYLVPLEAQVSSENELELEMVDAYRVLAKMEAASTDVNIVILDCCRNNPFERAFRSQVSGLAALDAPKGSLIAYATAPGTVASDGRPGGFGLYTGHLIREIRRPGLPIERVFKNVRLAVTSSQRDQVPWESSSLVGDFYFSATSSPEQSSVEFPDLPRGVYRGTVVFSYPDNSKLISSRVLHVGGSQNSIILKSSDYHETDRSRRYDSEIEVRGTMLGSVFYSKSQIELSTDYEQWLTEEMRFEFAADGRSLVSTSTYRDNGRLVVGVGTLIRE